MSIETDFSSGNPGTSPNPGGTTSTTGTTGVTGTTGMTGATGTSADEAQTTGGQTGSRLREELANLKRDLDTLMSRAASLTDRELSDARDRLMTRFGSMRESAKGVAQQAREQAKGVAQQAKGQLDQGMDVTAEYVRDKPLQSVALAAGIGLLLGVLLRRDRD